MRRLVKSSILLVLLSAGANLFAGTFMNGLCEFDDQDMVDPIRKSFRAHWNQFVQHVPEAPPGLDLEAEFRRPRKQVELQTVSVDTVERLRLLGHANLPLKILMVCDFSTRDEVQGMIRAVKDINDAEGLPPADRLRLQLIASDAEVLKGLTVSAEDFAANCEVCPYFRTEDIWMQDWGEIASVLVRGADKERTVVVDTHRGRGLSELPAILARQWSGHYVSPDSEEGPAGNYGGNIEVAPDGTLVIGDTSTERLREFFAQVGYRDRTCVLETEWLNVGHVDEYLSTLPTPDSPLGFTIVKASPRLALELLAAVPAAEMPGRLRAMSNVYYRHCAIAETGSIQHENILVETVVRYLGHLHEHLNGQDSVWTSNIPDFIAYNERCGAIIDRNIETLVQRLRERHGDVPVDVVAFPTLFDNEYGAVDAPTRALAMLPGVVNGVVLYDHMLVPDPLFKEYRDYIARTLDGLGYRAHFVPNGSYHFSHGQLHCGTNVFRHPNRYVHPRYATERKSTLFDVLHGE